MPNRKVLLISEQHVKDSSIIEQNVDGKVLSKVILNAQESHLKSVLGAEKYNELIEDVYLSATDEAHTMTEGNVELMDYVKPFLTFITLTDFIVVNNYKVSNKGTLKMNDNQGASISSQELEYARNYFENYATTYKKNLVEYLKEKGELQSDADTDIVFAATGFYIPRDSYCKN